MEKTGTGTPTIIATSRKEGWKAAEPAPPRKLSVVSLDTIIPEQVKWLWYPYIPAGKLTLLEGDPGLGKSWITCDLAARLTSGRPLPEQTTPLPPQNVLMLSAEDGLEDTVRPRVEALGGDLSRVFISDEFFILDAAGIKMLEDTMKQVAATIVFLDPLVAYLGGKVDINKANEARAMMGPLAQAAKRTGTAIVAVRHLRKAGGPNAKYNGIGSIDFTAAVRSGIAVKETNSGARVLFQFKNNLAPHGASIGYKLVDDKLEWLGKYEDVDESKPELNRVPKNYVKVRDFLIETLKDGPVDSVTFLSKAKEAGIGEKYLHTYKSGIAYSNRVDGHWQWELFAPHPQENKPKTLLTPELQKLVEEARARMSKVNLNG